MKKLILVFALFTLPFIMAHTQTVNLSVSYKFLNIEEGYDHLSTVRVFVDGIHKITSVEQIESKSGKVSIKMPKGLHQVRIVSCAKYEGSWEEHTVENNYSIDCEYSFEKNFEKTTKVKLVFDLNSGTTGTVN